MTADRGEAVVLTEGLTKLYGRTVGVKDLDLEVRPGEVFGFLGPNGAGKTTTIRLLLDLIRPTRGRATVFGLDCRRNSLAIRRGVGYVPGEFGLYENLTGAELLEYVAALRGERNAWAGRMLAERLDCDLSKAIGGLSRGNKQKIALVQAFMHSPELLVLDEPTSGLDPLMQQEVHDLISEAKREGRTVFVSSHNLHEVEHLCDRVGIIRAGGLVTTERVSQLKAKALRRVEIAFDQHVPREAFSHLPGVTGLEVRGHRLHCTVRGGVDALVKAAARFEVRDILSHEPDLEEIFLAFYERGDGDAP